MTDITQYNVADLVRDKVRQTMVDSIPDKQIDGMIMKEWDNFFKAPSSSWGNNNGSQFERLVRTEIENKVKEMTKDFVAKRVEPVMNQWDIDGGGQKSFDDLVKRMIPVVTEGYMAGIAANVLSQVQQQNQGY